MNIFRKLFERSDAHKVRKLDPSARDTEWGIRVQRDDAYVDQILRNVLKPDSNCVDVGAHQGVFLTRFLELSPHGRHFAFEPLPVLASALKQSFPAVTVYNCALGNSTGCVRFCHALELPGWSGLKTQPYPVKTEVEMIQVELKRLDALLPTGFPIHFIKIDVEGAELEVLEGAKNTIKQHKPCILFEHARIHNIEYRTTPDKVHDFLVNRCGLGIYSLNGKGPLSRRELAEIYYASFSSDYDRNTETNFLARP
jgi:FkbM family methyltransferase